jgi:hypothetical protein
MNSAPAELLHSLTNAALQPCFGYAGILLTPRPSPKKTPAITPAQEYCFNITKPFFKEKTAFSDKIGIAGENR